MYKRPPSKTGDTSNEFGPWFGQELSGSCIPPKGQGPHLHSCEPRVGAIGPHERGRTSDPGVFGGSGSSDKRFSAWACSCSHQVTSCSHLHGGPSTSRVGTATHATGDGVSEWCSCKHERCRVIRPLHGYDSGIDRRSTRTCLILNGRLPGIPIRRGWWEACTPHVVMRKYENIDDREEWCETTRNPSGRRVHTVNTRITFQNN